MSGGVPHAVLHSSTSLLEQFFTLEMGFNKLIWNIKMREEKSYSIIQIEASDCTQISTYRELEEVRALNGSQEALLMV